MTQSNSKSSGSANELLRRYASGARNFQEFKLDGADLTRANLTRVDLSGARLHDAKLIGTNLIRANLAGANLIRSHLVGARLNEARLSGTNLSGANLRGANLNDASLVGANLSDASLDRANLTRADLTGANLTRGTFEDTKFVGARLLHTVLVDIDLSAFCDVYSSIRHEGPSIVDYRSILKSLHSPNLKAFLQQTGMPEALIESTVECAKSLDGGVLKNALQSTFISYGHPDETFARRVYESLCRNGVTTFFFPEHGVPGKTLHETMWEGVNRFERVLLICSKASLERNGVLSEIEETLRRETRDGGASYLIPIALDEYVFDDWKPKSKSMTAQTVRDRVIANFCGADVNPTKFDAGILRIVAALRR